MARKKALPAGHSWDTGCRCADCKHAHYVALGQRGGEKNRDRHGKSYFSKLAKKSHPVNNPAAQRGEYTGGRPRKDANAMADGTGTK